MRKAALFDLDSTLTDHATAFARWADEFGASTGIPLSALMRAETLHGGARHAFFADLKSAFGLRRSVASLHADYRRRSAELVPYRPEVCTAMQQLADEGWELGVITNGSPDAQRRKLEVAHLTRYFASVVISGEYGIRKPDEALFQVGLDDLGVDDPAHAVMTGDFTDRGGDHVGADERLCVVERPVTGSRNGRVGWMVGDSVQNDVLGGRRAGLNTIWISHGRVWPLKDEAPDVIVDDVVDAMKVLLALDGE
ncbi:HAD family hydrolase [Streptomyces ardesiacus]